MTIYLRVTEIELGMRCQMQLFLLKTVGPRRPKGAAVTGTAFHKAAEVNFKEKAKTGKDAPESVLTDAFRDEFDVLSVDAEWDEEPPEKMFDYGITMVKSARANVFPELDVESENDVERKIEINCGELIITGTTDLVTPKGLQDFKTSQRKWQDGRAEKEIQGYLYPLGVSDRKILQNGGDLPPLNFRILTYNGQHDAHIVKHTVKEAQRFVTYARLLAEMLRFRNPIPNPYSHLCSEKWCGWFNLCPVFKKGD